MKNTGQSTNDNFKNDLLKLEMEVIEGVNSNSERYGGVYKEIAEILGDNATMKIWKHFSGLNVTFPQRLYSKEYTREYIKENMKLVKPADIAKTMGLSERRIRQIITEIKRENINTSINPVENEEV